MKRLEHVEKHLRPQVREFVRHLVEPLTLDEIATATHYSHSHVEKAWGEIRAVMALLDGSGPTSVARLALLRIVMGLDPCVCERFYAELEKSA